MTAAATKVKQITVNFNKAVDTATTKLVVKKSAATPTITSTTFAADAKSAEIALGTKLTAGTYTVEATVGEEKLTADITVEDEKLNSFELVSSDLVASATMPTFATISYKALNQYGQMMNADEPSVSCTFGTVDNSKVTGSGATAPTADKSGKITVGDINTALAIPGTTGTIVIVDKSSGVNLNTTVTYQSKAVPAAATVYGIYSLKTDKLIEGNLSTGAKASDYAILINVKDQYGNDMTPDDIHDSEVEVTYNPAAILTDLKIDSTNNKVAGNEKEVTYEGTSAFLIPLKSDSTGGKLAEAGSLSLTIVSGQKGVIASPTFTVDKAKIIKTLSVAPSSTVYAGEDNALTVEAYDAAGNAITAYDDLKAAELHAKSTVNTVNGSDDHDELVLKKNTDGTGTLYFNPDKDDFDDENKNFKESKIGTIIFTANSTTSSDYLVKTVNVTYYEPRQAWAVAGKTDKTVNACAISGTLKLNLTTLSYEDQYSNTVKANEGTAAAVTGDVSIAILDPYGVFGDKDGSAISTAIAGADAKLASGSVVGNDLVLKSIAGKGDATLFFRYMRPSASEDRGYASENKYDFKLTISATSVSDTTASDLKLVVNNGNAICASSSEGVTLNKADVTNPDNQDGNVDGAAATNAYVYVTGVVNGKTVVIPSSQYHLVTRKIDSLGAYNAKDNDKTETKTVTVVVDSESGAQELTADVTVSNKPSAITTVKTADAKGVLNNIGARTVTASNLIEGIKVLDQYGNTMNGQDEKFRYEITLTGTSADLATEIKGQATQDISIDFKSDVDNAADTDTKITATVKYTTLDGKITFTQDVSFELGA